MSLLDEARGALTWRRHPDTPEMASVPVEARDALVELADTARAFVATTSYYRQRKESRPEFEEFAVALERLQR